MDPSMIEFSIRDRVAHLWLNRPHKRNALNAAMLEELTSLFTSLSGQVKARMLIIRGRGRIFSAGADLAFLSDTGGKTDEELLTEAAMFFDCFDSLYRLPIPVICYAHGAVHGGANGLVAASDFVLCTEDTRFSFSEVRLGLVPATVAPFVLPRMGIVRARQYMISGEIMDGKQACAGGLADRVVRQEDAEGEIGKMVAMLKQNAPGAVMMTKKMLLGLEHRDIDHETRALLTDMIARARKSDEAREGMDAFFSRRIPNWINTK
jgi:methylglutaconyl-CoA hydratase